MENKEIDNLCLEKIVTVAEKRELTQKSLFYQNQILNVNYQQVPLYSSLFSQKDNPLFKVRS